MQFLPRGGALSEQIIMRKWHGIIGVAGFIVKQPWAMKNRATWLRPLAHGRENILKQRSLIDGPWTDKLYLDGPLLFEPPQLFVSRYGTGLGKARAHFSYWTSVGVWYKTEIYCLYDSYKRRKKETQGILFYSIFQNQALFRDKFPKSSRKVAFVLLQLRTEHILIVGLLIYIPYI